MLIKKLEIIKDLTEEKEKEFRAFIVKHLKDNKARWVGIECLNYNGALIAEALIALKEIVESFCTLDVKLKIITTLIYSDVKSDYNAKTVIKFFDEKPNIIESIII